ncbi:hypothetical protein HX744_26040 [Pseudonocardia sp. ICBG1122]|nr:hypothetical protein [Pseudonocardia pini]
MTLFAGRSTLLSRWVRLVPSAARNGLPPGAEVVACDNAADPAFAP